MLRIPDRPITSGYRDYAARIGAGEAICRAEAPASGTGLTFLEQN